MEHTFGHGFVDDLVYIAETLIKRFEVSRFQVILECTAVRSYRGLPESIALTIAFGNFDSFDSRLDVGHDSLSLRLRF